MRRRRLHYGWCWVRVIFVDEDTRLLAMASENVQEKESPRSRNEIAEDLTKWSLETDDSMLTLSVSLADTEFWSIPTGLLEDAERSALIAGRKAHLKGSQDVAESFIVGLDGRVLHRFWLVNHVLFTIPKDQAAELINLPGMIDIQRDEPGPPPTFDGSTLKDGGGCKVWAATMAF